MKFEPASLVENTYMKLSDSNMMVVSNQQMISNLNTEQIINDMSSINQYEKKLMKSNNAHVDQECLDVLLTSKSMPKGILTNIKQNNDKLGIQVG